MHLEIFLHCLFLKILDGTLFAKKTALHNQGEEYSTGVSLCWQTIRRNTDIQLKEKDGGEGGKDGFNVACV